MTYEEFCEDYNKRAPEMLKAELIKLMEEMGWDGINIKAYAPSFNDGDPCYYGLRACHGIKSRESHDEDEEDWDPDIAELVQIDIQNLHHFGEGELVFRKDGTVKVSDYYDY